MTAETTGMRSGKVKIDTHRGREVRATGIEQSANWDERLVLGASFSSQVAESFRVLRSKILHPADGGPAWWIATFAGPHSPAFSGSPMIGGLPIMIRKAAEDIGKDKIIGLIFNGYQSNSVSSRLLYKDYSYYGDYYR